MNYHLIKINKTGNGFFTMVPPKSTTKIMCFIDRNKALNFKQCISQYKANYGTWPNMNMNSDYEKIEVKHQIPLVITSKEVDVVDIKDDDLYSIIRNTNIGLMLCYDFNTDSSGNTFTMNITGQELDFEIDNFAYLRNLDSLFNDN